KVAARREAMPEFVSGNAKLESGSRANPSPLGGEGRREPVRRTGERGVRGGARANYSRACPATRPLTPVSLRSLGPLPQGARATEIADTQPLEPARGCDILRKVFSTLVAAWKPAMNFYFCEPCGKRLTDIDLVDGRARDKQVKGIYCKACAESVMTMEFE